MCISDYGDIMEWDKRKKILRTEFRIILNKKIMADISYNDRNIMLKLKDKLFMLPGVQGVRYDKNETPSILLWLEAKSNNKDGWHLIEKTINEHINYFENKGVM